MRRRSRNVGWECRAQHPKSPLLLVDRDYRGSLLCQRPARQKDDSRLAPPALATMRRARRRRLRCREPDAKSVSRLPVSTLPVLNQNHAVPRRRGRRPFSSRPHVVPRCRQSSTSTNTGQQKSPAAVGWRASLGTSEGYNTRPIRETRWPPQGASARFRNGWVIVGLLSSVRSHRRPWARISQPFASSMGTRVAMLSSTALRTQP